MEGFVIKRPSWDEYFLLVARMVAIRSTCLSRQVGVVIAKNNRVISTGYNGSLPGHDNCCDSGSCYYREMKKNKKFCLSSHAEKNAIGVAAKAGVSLDGATLYTTLSPCVDCAKLIVTSGIKRTVFETGYQDPVEDLLNQRPYQLLADSDVLIGGVSLTKNINMDTVCEFLKGARAERQLPIVKELVKEEC